MKKTLVRVLAFALVLILALGIIPLGALAVNVTVDAEAYDSHPSVAEWIFAVDREHNWSEGQASGTGSVTIKTSNYDSLVAMPDGCLYDLKGIVDPTEEVSSFSSDLPLSHSVTYHTNGHAWLIYTTHQHKLSYWYSDSTTHWRECLSCKKHLGKYDQFMYQNWHSDGDEDRVCDVCGEDIPYHEIEVEDTKGGKITVELDEAPHRKKIVATAEPEDGYKLKKIHFIKVRDNGTEQEITRRKTSTKGTWWTYMPTYDLKVTAEFVKKK